MSGDPPTDAVGAAEEAWPQAVVVPQALPRVALKVGLLVLNFARAQAMLETRLAPSPGSSAGRICTAAPGSSADSETLAVQRVRGAIAVLQRFRNLLIFGACGVSASEPGQSARLNWAGAYLPDAERQAGWLAPGEGPGGEGDGAMRAGQIEEWELDTAMLHLGLALRDLENFAVRPSPRSLR